MNYNSLPEDVWEELLPDQYGVQVDSGMIERMKAISQNYSKSRNKDSIAFEKDGEAKRDGASQAVVQAAQAFTGDVYQKMETLSGRGDGEDPVRGRH